MFLSLEIQVRTAKDEQREGIDVSARDPGRVGRSGRNELNAT